MGSSSVLGVIIMSLGHVAGYALSLIAPEELEPGRRYFQLLRKALLASLFGIAVLMLADNLWISAAAAAIIFLLLFKVSIRRLITLVFIYAGAVFSAWKGTDMFLMFAGVGFLYLMTDTTLQILSLGEKEKLFAKDKELHIMLNKRKLIAKRVFLVPGIMLAVSIVLFLLLRI